jgi:hypothetical protein
MGSYNLQEQNKKNWMLLKVPGYFILPIILIHVNLFFFLHLIINRYPFFVIEETEFIMIIQEYRFYENNKTTSFRNPLLQ